MKPLGPIGFARPKFPTPAHYVQNCRDCFASGHSPWPAETADELQAALEAFPKHRHRWNIGNDEMNRLGLLPPPQLSDKAKDRFLASLMHDEEFSTAAILLLKRRAQCR